MKFSLTQLLAAILISNLVWILMTATSTCGATP